MRGWHIISGGGGDRLQPRQVGGLVGESCGCMMVATIDTRELARSRKMVNNAARVLCFSVLYARCVSVCLIYIYSAYVCMYVCVALSSG